MANKAPTDSPVPKYVKTKPEPVQRRYSENMQVDSDLYKLEVAKMLKNIGWENAYPDPDTDLVAAEHTHFYHTVDSDGKEQIHSAPIGGHFHLMELVKSEVEWEPPLVKCVSGPLRWGHKKVSGRLKKVTVPVNTWDNHSHDVTYIRSNKVAKRKINTEAVAVQTMEANKMRPIPGIGG